LQKVPFLFVVGKREAEERNVAIRTLGSDGQTIKNVDVAIEDLALAAEPPY
jgi:threonyl-tRNA synthetase